MVWKMEVANVKFRINTAYRENLKPLAKSYLEFKICHRLEGEKSHKAVNTLIIPLASGSP